MEAFPNYHFTFHLIKPCNSLQFVVKVTANRCGSSWDWPLHLFSTEIGPWPSKDCFKCVLIYFSRPYLFSYSIYFNWYRVQPNYNPGKKGQLLFSNFLSKGYSFFSSSKGFISQGCSLIWKSHNIKPLRIKNWSIKLATYTWANSFLFAGQTAFSFQVFNFIVYFKSYYITLKTKTKLKS